MINNRIEQAIIDSIAVKTEILNDKDLQAKIEDIVNRCCETYKHGGKILFCGNGGSAADAQHLAAELSGRFYFDRAPLYAEALHVNSSYVTAVANDYSYDDVFARMILATGKKGDVLIGFSTSGNSKNIIKAFKTAQEIEMTVIALTGKNGGKLAEISDILLNVPSTDTPRIQESHILIGHIICELIEAKIFKHE